MSLENRGFELGCIRGHRLRGDAKGCKGVERGVKGCRLEGGCWWACANRQRSSDVGCALRLHCNENPIYVFSEKELRGLSPNFPFMCL